MKLRAQVKRAGHPLHRLPQSQQRGLRAAGDVVNVVAAVRLHGQDVRPRDVLDEDEVHRGRPVAVDLGTLVVVDAVEPADEHLGVGAGHVHPRAVHVEVPQPDARQAVHLVEAAGDAFVHDLGGAVERAIVIRVVLLVGRKRVRAAVDAGRGGVHDLLDLVGDGGLEDVERAHDQHVHALAGLLGAERDADGGLVEDVVTAGDGVADRGAVADVALQESEAAARLLQVPQAAADQVVQHADFPRPLVDQAVHDVRADQARPADHQHRRAVQRRHRPLPPANG